MSVFLWQADSMYGANAGGAPFHLCRSKSSLVDICNSGCVQCWSLCCGLMPDDLSNYRALIQLRFSENDVRHRPATRTEFVDHQTTHSCFTV